MGSNVFTGQPVAARFDDCYASERDLLVSLLEEFNAGDLALLDMGFEGFQVWKQFEQRGQKFINRIRTRGNVPHVVRKFLESGKKTDIVEFFQAGDKLRLRLIRAKNRDRKGAPIVLVTNLLDEKKYKTRTIWKLYKRRWDSETMYYRVKKLFNLEKFHAKTVHGVLQEIWANLFILSLIALLVLLASKQWGMGKGHRVPNFKNASEVLRRNLVYCISGPYLRHNEAFKKMLDEVAQVVFIRKPGRKNPRISKQPANTWNLRRPLAKNRPSNKWEKNRVERLKNA